MNTTLRAIIGVLVGVVIAGLVIFGVEMLGHQVYPVPGDLDLNNQQDLADFVATLPIGAFAFILAAWFLGTFLGGFAAAKIAGQHHGIVAGIIAVLVLAGAIFNMINIAHPIWFMGIAVAGIPLSGYLAARLA